ncbi:quinoprotein dehydrogenase-associated putative ABC transporter substrate-binding protein [Methyloligella sp. 2.7D]|uniref:quinoprotein dehydrogenase-associated putative ABC transporter substrate-binding protein n=1 Tax=unclassified Methyloligella TaxID=2625955 RepID=UPI00157C387F|nr:quinoprotein dehydrogenase-associated putative ABC transporter substrate-binding protein [Methyloligella sp. GL2]QKP77326.1 quinoprotein dehydrogenase-associated putative ABC transporter substrate-binding protein [Methyloligella sp. GL2]
MAPWRAVLAAAVAIFALIQAPATVRAEPENGVLRVCADPDNLPFSNLKGEGFENKLAELIADRLDLKLSYSWYPEVHGGMPTPFSNRDCDIVMGYAQGTELIEDTNPYYYTSYALIYRRDDPALQGVTRLSDPRLKGKRIGIFSRTPPATLLATNGLTSSAVPFDSPFSGDADQTHDLPRQMINQVAYGKLDAAILWGPIGGYVAKSSHVPLEVVPLVNETAGPEMIYGITMGVRPNEPQWKHRLNKLIAEDQPAINAILLRYNVPLLQPNGKVIKAASAER